MELEAALGQHPAEFATTGELAELMLRLPPDTLLRIAEHIRVDPTLHLDHDEDRTTAAATVLSLPQDPRVGDGRQRRTGTRVAAVELGAVLVAEDGTVPANTAPFCPHARAVEALHTGDPVALLDAHREMVDDAGRALGGDVDASPADWIADPDLRDALRVEGHRLRQSAARLAVLRERVAAHEATRKPPNS